jgi:hypothetical protein
MDENKEQLLCFISTEMKNFGGFLSKISRHDGRKIRLVLSPAHLTGLHGLLKSGSNDIALPTRSRESSDTVGDLGTRNDSSQHP